MQSLFTGTRWSPSLSLHWRRSRELALAGAYRTWSYYCSFREDTGTSADPRMTPGTSLIPEAPGIHSRRRVVTDTSEACVPGKLFKQRVDFLADEALTCHQHWWRKEKSKSGKSRSSERRQLGEGGRRPGTVGSETWKAVLGLRSHPSEQLLRHSRLGLAL